LEDYVKTLPKSKLVVTKVEPVLSSEIQPFGYIYENKGMKNLVFLTKDNVLIMISSMYLNDAEFLKFANSLY
ncbi:MAG: hypothetical protein WCI04_07460, partial [archaeon]